MLCSVATPGHPEPLLLENNILIVALMADLLRVSLVHPLQLHHQAYIILILYEGVLSEL